MVSRDELAQLMKEVSAAELAQRSGVSMKTIYRLRNKENFPNLQTVERLMVAIRELPRAKAEHPAPRG